jgi:hypothetical protein
MKSRCDEEVRGSEAERAELWDLYESGESERTIATRLGRNKGSIRPFLLDNAGAVRVHQRVLTCD